MEEVEEVRIQVTVSGDEVILGYTSLPSDEIDALLDHLRRILYPEDFTEVEA
jgi:hypothetical protein